MDKKYAHRLYRLYQLVLYILFPLIVFYTFIIALRYRSLCYFKQRLGYFQFKGQSPLWFHCASMGEVNAVIPLIQNWLKKYENDQIIVTTNTVTGAKILQNNMNRDNVKHYYLPLDYRSMCKHFLANIKPRCALIVETEIWLHLFNCCQFHNIPILILNARLSKKTVQHRWLYPYYRLALMSVEHIYARNKDDAAAYARLSARLDKITVLGNLKHSVSFSNTLINNINRPYFLAASTHDKEEMGIAAAFKKINKKNAFLLVIVPRHPRRGGTIKKQIKKSGLCVQKRSDNNELQKKTEVYIADTIGELPALIQYADLVITGGAFVPHGGQNVLEAAVLKTPQITGPYTFNFQEEIEMLSKAQGIIQINQIDQLTDIFNGYLTDRETYTRMAENAYACMLQHRHVVDDYQRVIEKAFSLP